MHRQRVQRARNGLRKLLRLSNKEDFFRMIWAVDALQSERGGNVGELLAHPPTAVTTDIANKNFAHKWMLETLVNERHCYKTKDWPSQLNCQNYLAFLRTFNALYSLENAEDGLFLETNDVRDELPRIGHRQFEWQRGWNTQWNMYRSSYLYCGPAATEYFSQQHGLTPAKFVLSGYAAYIASLAGPGIVSPLVMPEIELERGDFELALPLLSISMTRAARVARELRRLGTGRTAYRPSLLRQFPCVSVVDSRHLLVPLPSLVLARVTTGLFYDLVKAGAGSVRQEMADRFESYTRELLAAMLPDMNCRPEAIYQLGGREAKTPDVLLYQDDSCSVVVECKSTRMTMGVRFGEDPAAEAERALGELTKAVLQIWRYCSHVRRGLIPGHAVNSDAIGIAVTLDPWLRMTRGRKDSILERAVVLADREGQVEAVDRRAVAFCAIDDLEVLLSHSTKESFLATVRAAAEPANAAWNLANLHRRDYAPNPAVTRPYPFFDRLGEILPWWNAIRKL